jgi:hypothetical protein
LESLPWLRGDVLELPSRPVRWVKRVVRLRGGITDRHAYRTAHWVTVAGIAGGTAFLLLGVVQVGAYFQHYQGADPGTLAAGIPCVLLADEFEAYARTAGATMQADTLWRLSVILADTDPDRARLLADGGSGVPALPCREAVGGRPRRGLRNRRSPRPWRARP